MGSEEGFTGAGMMESLIGSLFAEGIFKGLGKLIAPMLTAAFAKSILKFLGKATLFAWLGTSLLMGIKDGWDTWKETGDLGKAILSGLRGTLSAMTFGMLSPEDIAEIDAKINEKIKGMFNGLVGALETLKTRLGINTDKESKLAALDAEKKGIISELNSTMSPDDEMNGRSEDLHARLKEIEKERDKLNGKFTINDSNYKTPAGSKVNYAARSMSAVMPDSFHKTPAGSKVNYAARMAAAMPDSFHKTPAGSKRDPGIVLKDTRELGPKSMEMINSERDDRSMIEAFGGNASVVEDVKPKIYDDVQTHLLQDGTYGTFSIQKNKDEAAARKAARSNTEAYGGEPSVVKDAGANLGARMNPDSDYKQVGGGAFKLITKPLWEQDTDGKISIYLYDDASAAVGKSEGMINLMDELSNQDAMTKRLTDTSTPPMMVAHSNDSINNSVVNNNSFSTPAAVSGNHNDRLQSRFATRSMA